MNRNPVNYGTITDPEVGFSGDRNDISSEFSSLSNEIATQVFTITSNTRILQDAFKLIGTQRDNMDLRKKIHNTQSTTNRVASETANDIKKLNFLVPKNDQKKKLQANKLEEDFTEAVNTYCSFQKKLAEKQKAHLLITINDEPSDDEETAGYQKQAEISRDLQFEQDMMLEREERIKQIEADVLDINHITRMMGSMVHDQASVVDRIAENVDHAVGNVDDGAKQLRDAATYQNKSRRKLLILVIIALLVVAILITILVTQLKR